MIGACTSEISKTKDIWLVIEFCELGELKNYLIGNKETIISGTNSKEINSRCLLLWSHDIAKGMQYLSENYIMHGDLAARNIMLDEDPLKIGCSVAKVADLGLSKKLYGDMTYEKQNRTMIPWKWMAPELLKNDYLTLRSDVWSFGVFLPKN
jgi:serine/threonine protein kinase